MFRRISHVAIEVAALELSVEFYRCHFGFEKYFEHALAGGTRIAILRLGDTALELVERPGARLGGFHFCLETDDFGAAVRALEAGSVAVVRQPHDAPLTEPREAGWRRAVYRGPDGELIEIRG
jgi:lactoylglutathione lyase